MNAPQIIMITLLAISLGMTTAKHGEPKTGRESGWNALIAMAIQFGILYWGGFFTAQ